MSKRRPSEGDTDADGLFDQVTPPPTDLDELVRWAMRTVPDRLMELRERIRQIEARPNETHDEIAALQAAVTDIHGRSGNNGKLGELRRSVEKMEATMNAAIKEQGGEIKILNAFKWKLLGMATMASIVGSGLVAVLSKLL